VGNPTEAVSSTCESLPGKAWQLQEGKTEMQKNFRLSPPHDAGLGLFARMMKTLERHFGNGNGDISRFPRKPEPSGSQMEPLPADALVRPSMHNKVTVQIHHDDWP
jgi:hypothetical protein